MNHHLHKAYFDKIPCITLPLKTLTMKHVIKFYAANRQSWYTGIECAPHFSKESVIQIYNFWLFFGGCSKVMVYLSMKIYSGVENKLIQWCSRIFNEQKCPLSWSWLKNHPQAARKLVCERPLHGHLCLLHLANHGGLEECGGGKEIKKITEQNLKLHIRVSSFSLINGFSHHTFYIIKRSQDYNQNFKTKNIFW